MPSDLSVMTALKEISLDDTVLPNSTYGLDGFSTLPTLNTLRTMNVANCSWVAQLRNLTSLTLDGFYNYILPNDTGFPNLTSLFVRGSPAFLPERFFNLPKVKSVRIDVYGGSADYYRIPPSFVNMTSVEYFYISGGQLVGDLPPLSIYPNLTNFIMTFCGLNIPDYASNSLISVDISYMNQNINITAIGPGGAPNLRYLSLRGIPSVYRYPWPAINATQLDTLILDEVPIEGPIPPEIFTPSLRAVLLSGLGINGTVPSAITEANLTTISMFALPALGGTIPGPLPNLAALFLSQTGISDLSPLLNSSPIQTMYVWIQ